MNEKKYYVKSLLKQNSPSSLWLDSVGTFDYSSLRKAYTKSELENIENGDYYKRAPYGEIFETGIRTGWYHVTDDDSFDDEWINPLIELVPVEDGE